MHIPWDRHQQALWETRHWCGQYLQDHPLDLGARPEVLVVPMEDHLFVTRSRPLSSCLRTPALRPSNYPDGWACINVDAQEFENLIQKRKALLQVNGEPTLRGRILCAGEETDTYMGEAPSASMGLIDDIYLPPWDTWFAFLPGEKAGEGVLLSWIPELLEEQVQQAIDVGATQPLMWLDRIETLEVWGGNVQQQQLVLQAHTVLLKPS